MRSEIVLGKLIVDKRERKRIAFVVPVVDIVSGGKVGQKARSMGQQQMAAVTIDADQKERAGPGDCSREKGEGHAPRSSRPQGGDARSWCNEPAERRTDPPPRLARADTPARVWAPPDART